MAKIKIHCPECSQRIGIDESATGSTGDCPTCGSSLAIPADPTQPVRILVRRPLPPGSLVSDEENEETARLKKELAAAHEELARLRTQLEHSAHEFERFRITLDGMAELRGHLAAEREKSAAFAKERDAIVRQVAETGDLKLAGEALTHEITRLQQQLANATRERSDLQKAARESDERARAAHLELDQMSAKLDQKSMSLREAVERMTTWERDRASQRPSVLPDPATLQALSTARADLATSHAELAKAKARLAELEAAVSAITRERDEGRAELARRDAVQREAAAALRTLRAESDRAKAEAAEAIGRRDLVLGSKQSEIELLRRTIAEMKGGTVAEPKGETQITERLRQIERQLGEGRESFRAMKNERFKLRERLAKIDADPQSTDAANAEQLRKQLNELLARDEAMQKYGQVLVAEQENLKRRLLPTKIVEPTKSPPESQLAPPPAPPPKTPPPPPEPAAGTPPKSGVAQK